MGADGLRDMVSTKVIYSVDSIFIEVRKCMRMRVYVCLRRTVVRRARDRSQRSHSYFVSPSLGETTSIRLLPSCDFSNSIEELRSVSRWPSTINGLCFPHTMWCILVIVVGHLRLKTGTTLRFVDHDPDVCRSPHAILSDPDFPLAASSPRCGSKDTKLFFECQRVGREELGCLGAVTSQRWVPHSSSFLFPSRQKRILS
jgi:hypothetical protein